MERLRAASKALRVLCLSAGVAATPALAETEGNQLVKEWLSLEIQRGKLESAWDDRKIILDQQAQLLEEEASALRELIESHASSTSETDQERATVLAEQGRLEQQQARLTEKVDLAAHKLSAAVKRLPPPLRASWSKSLSPLERTDMSLSDRLDTLLRLLNELHEFNERVAIHSGNVSVPAEDGGAARKVLVTQVYLGAVRGWYVSQDGSHYGYGESRQEGWRWWHNTSAQEPLGHELSPAAVQALVEIVQSPDKAALAGLPLAAGTMSEL